MDNAVLGLTGQGELDTDPLGLGASVEYVGCMYTKQVYVLTFLIVSVTWIQRPVSTTHQYTSSIPIDRRH